MSRPLFDIVVAATRTGLIGHVSHEKADDKTTPRAGMPWPRLRQDLKRFKELTTGGVVIMGRTTWQSLPLSNSESSSPTVNLSPSTAGCRILGQDLERRMLPNRHNIVISRQEKCGSECACSGESKSFSVVHSFEDALHLGQQLNRPLFVIGGGQIYEQAVRHPACRRVFLTELLHTKPSLSEDENKAAADFVGNVFFKLPAQQFVLEKVGNLVLDEPCVYQFLEYARRPEEEQYLELVRKVMREGTVRHDRTGTGTVAILGHTARWSLRNHSFPLLTTKRVFWRGVVEELLWFVRGTMDLRDLQAKNVKIWDANAAVHHKKRVAAGELEHQPHDCGPIYGHAWRHFGAPWVPFAKETRGDEKTEKTVKAETKSGVDQLAEIIRLIREDPYSRRLVMSAWDPTTLEKVALPPCHVLYQFFVEPTKKELSCVLYQRSGDIALGIPFNIASASLLTCMVAHVTGLHPGELVHVIGDAHIYNNTVQGMKEQLLRKPRVAPTLRIRRPIASIDAFSFDDFMLENYNPHPTINMGAMSV